MIDGNDEGSTEEIMVGRFEGEKEFLTLGCEERLIIGAEEGTLEGFIVGRAMEGVGVGNRRPVASNRIELGSDGLG